MHLIHEEIPGVGKYSPNSAAINKNIPVCSIGKFSKYNYFDRRINERSPGPKYVLDNGLNSKSKLERVVSK